MIISYDQFLAGIRNLHHSPFGYQSGYDSHIKQNSNFLIYNHSAQDIWKSSNNHPLNHQFFVYSQNTVLLGFLNNWNQWFCDSVSLFFSYFKWYPQSNCWFWILKCKKNQNWTMKFGSSYMNYMKEEEPKFHGYSYSQVKYAKG
jgi:hypothetical protein